MKQYLLTMIFASLVMLSSAYGESIKIRVETLHRITSESAACLDGCRILGKDLVNVVGSPKGLGRFIANSMIDNAISISLDIMDLDLKFDKRTLDEGTNSLLSRVQKRICTPANGFIWNENKVGRSRELRCKSFSKTTRQIGNFYK